MSDFPTQELESCYLAFEGQWAGVFIDHEDMEEFGQVSEEVLSTLKTLGAGLGPLVQKFSRLVQRLQVPVASESIVTLKPIADCVKEDDSALHLDCKGLAQEGKVFFTIALPTAVETMEVHTGHKRDMF